MNAKARQISNLLRVTFYNKKGSPRKAVIAILISIAVIILLAFLGIIDLNTAVDLIQTYLSNY